MNKNLLEKVKEMILANPENLSLDTWCQGRLKADNPTYNCGSTACIAGHIVLITRGELSQEDAFTFGDYIENPVFMFARLELGISQEKAAALFLEWEWPMKFRNAISRCARFCDSKIYAQVVADRIDHFIENGE